MGVYISGQSHVVAHAIVGTDKIIHGDEYISYPPAQVTFPSKKSAPSIRSNPLMVISHMFVSLPFKNATRTNSLDAQHASQVP